MKKVISFLFVVLVLGMLTSACVVAPYPHGRARATFRVSYVVRAGVRVYVVPAGVRPGDIIIINGKRCTVRKVRRNRIKVVYPDGAVAWIRVEFR